MQVKTVAQGEKNPAEAGEELVGEFFDSLDGFQKVVGEFGGYVVKVFLSFMLRLALRHALSPVGVKVNDRAV